MSTAAMTIEDLLGDFSPTPPEEPRSLKEGKPVTIWLPANAKAGYDRLQEKSGRRFGKKAREVLIELIELAEQRIP
jgi:shikimate kinase